MSRDLEGMQVRAHIYPDTDLKVQLVGETRWLMFGDHQIGICFYGDEKGDAELRRLRDVIDAHLAQQAEGGEPR